MKRSKAKVWPTSWKRPATPTITLKGRGFEATLPVLAVRVVAATPNGLAEAVERVIVERMAREPAS
jgi:hypothetical protein